MFRLRARATTLPPTPPPSSGLLPTPKLISNVSKFRLMKTRCRGMKILITPKGRTERESVIVRVEVKINRDMWW